MYLIFFKYNKNKDEYIPFQAGEDIVPTEIVDKVLPVSRNVVRQFEKVVYKNGKLTLKDGMKLLPDAELDRLDLMSISDMEIPFKTDNNNIVEIDY